MSDKFPLLPAPIGHKLAVLQRVAILTISGMILADFRSTSK